MVSLQYQLRSVQHVQLGRCVSRECHMDHQWRSVIDGRSNHDNIIIMLSWWLTSTLLQMLLLSSTFLLVLSNGMLQSFLFACSISTLVECTLVSTKASFCSPLNFMIFSACSAFFLSVLYSPTNSNSLLVQVPTALMWSPMKPCSGEEETVKGCHSYLAMDGILRKI